MNENEYSIFEDRAYLNPTLSRDEQLQFVDTLRDVQARNTAQVNRDTYALGTQVPNQLGGLGGANNTFVARYQKPQTEQTVAQLRQAAQDTALKTALNNLTNAYKKRYNDAMLNYQKRAATASTTQNPSDTDPNFQSHEQVRGKDYLEVDSNDGSVTVVANDKGGMSVYETNPDGSVGKWLYDVDSNNNRIEPTQDAGPFNIGNSNLWGTAWQIGSNILGGGVASIPSVAATIYNWLSGGKK